MMLPRARFAFAAVILAAAAVLVAFLQTIDPGISHALNGISHAVANTFSSVGHLVADTLNRHPSETAFSIASVVIQPLAVKTKDAWTMLGCSNAHGYNLIAQGELDSYLDGRVRKVVVESIRAYIERKLAAAKKDKGPKRTEKATAARMEQYANGVEPPRRGKQRKPAPAPIASPAPDAATSAEPSSPLRHAEQHIAAE
jgi:hypothetical protein